MSTTSFATKLLGALTTPHGPLRLRAMSASALLPGMGRVSAIEQVSPEVVELSLEVGQDFTGFAAGQYLQLGQQINGRWVKRPFSPACAPFSGAGELKFAIRIQEQGLWTSQLQQRTQVGQPMMVGAAAGDYRLPADNLAIEHLILVSGGTGLAPNLSLAREALNRHIPRITLLHYARDMQQIPGQHQLSQLQQQPGLRWQPVCTQQKPTVTQLWAGHFKKAHIDELRTPQEQTHIMVCGPATLRTAVHKYASAKTSHCTAQSESFGSPIALRPKQSKTAAVQFSRSSVQATSHGQSLLELAEAKGLNPEFGCRMGICASCTCRKTQGQVRDLRDGSLSASGEEDIRLCVSAPVGEVHINL